MLLLTDQPSRAAAIVPASTTWCRSSLEHLPEGLGSLWCSLGAEGSPWTAQLDPPLGASFWPYLVIIDEAPASQFDALRQLYRDGRRLGGPVACLALTGRRFHGHRARPWVAERGNLHLSVGLEPGLSAQRLLPALTMLPAVAVVDAIEVVTQGSLRAGIKWVNDVLVSGRKVAGVLTSTQTRQYTVDAAVLGVGLNVARSPSVPPTVFVPEVGCLADWDAAGPDALADVCWAVLRELELRLEQLASRGPGELLERYRSASVVLGEQVRIYDETFRERPLSELWPEPLAMGTVERIDEDLSLRLQGQERAVDKGRLAFEAACRQLGLPAHAGGPAQR